MLNRRTISVLLLLLAVPLAADDTAGAKDSAVKSEAYPVTRTRRPTEAKGPPPASPAPVPPGSRKKGADSSKATATASGSTTPAAPAVSFAGTAEGAKKFTQVTSAPPPLPKVDPAKKAEVVKAFMVKTGFPRGRDGWVAKFVIPICKGGKYETWNLQWVDEQRLAAQASQECD